MERKIETIIIGGGQAGLALSYYLTQQNREHIVLEQAAQAANAWRNQRWNSFVLNTPNWMTRLPGAEYSGNDRDGFLPRAEIVSYLEDYVERFNLPIQYRTRVTAVEQNATGYRVRTGDEEFLAMNVVVATGSFQQSKIPSVSANLPKAINQIKATEYRNADQLAPGAILVVGSAQTGCQIAEDLYENGRQVYLCVGSAGRFPRRYRGKDIFWWLNQAGFFDQRVDQLKSPKEKFAANPQISGTKGGHTINLHQFARDGVILLGRLQGIQDSKLIFPADLKETLARIDQFEANAVKRIDEFIDKTGIDAPQEELPQLRDGYNAQVITELDLASAGISTVIWAMGFNFDFSLVKLPVVDDDGFPIQNRGVTKYPGLYFLGMNWLYKRKSSLLCGVGEDAAFLASCITERK